MSSKFQVGDRVRIKEHTLYAPCAGKKGTVTSVDAPSSVKVQVDGVSSTAFDGGWGFFPSSLEKLGDSIRMDWKIIEGVADD